MRFLKSDSERFLFDVCRGNEFAADYYSNKFSLLCLLHKNSYLSLDRPSNIILFHDDASPATSSLIVKRFKIITSYKTHSEKMGANISTHQEGKRYIYVLTKDQARFLRLI